MLLRLSVSSLPSYFSEKQTLSPPSWIIEIFSESVPTTNPGKNFKNAEDI